MLKYRQSAWIADVLGLSYSQAHRRMNGQSPWSLEDLSRVAERVGESLADVVALGDRGGDDASVRGVLLVGSSRLECRLWLGPVLQATSPETVVAVQTGSGWTALAAREATDQVTYAVDRLEARPSSAARKVIAVLDDDQDLTDSICAHFSQSGYDARPFYRAEKLVSDAAAQKFDGYVVDWIVGGTDVQKLVASLRAQDASCPIIVLTGQVETGVVAETDIAEAVQRYDLMFNEKPVRTSILAAMLGRAFAPAN